MATTVLGLYDNSEEADRVVSELIGDKFDAESISRVSPRGPDTVNEHAPGRQSGRGPLGIGANLPAGQLDDRLRDYGVPENAASRYAQGVRAGGEMVAARVDDARTSEAVAIFDRHNPIDVENRYGRGQGRKAASSKRARREVAEGDKGEQRIPLPEEELQVGKRKVEGGSVRVYTHVIEEPVREDVTLREEHVDVERRRVDRPVEAGDEAFQERTIELSESREEPVVRKTSRVIEEVVIDKDITEHTEQVEDTVRRTEAEIDRTGASRGDAASRGMRSSAEEEYRQHFERTLASHGYEFDQSMPAYRYGERLAQNDRFRDRDWSEVEPEARRLFEQRNPGAWDEFEPAIHEGYMHGQQQR